MLQGPLLLLLACPGDPGADRVATEATGQDSAGATPETGDSDAPGPLAGNPVITALTSASPGTLPAASGGVLTITADAAAPEGELEQYLDPAYTFTIDLGDGDATAVSLTVPSPSQLDFTFTVPAGMDAGRAGHALAMNGIPFLSVPVALSGDNDAVVAGMVGQGVVVLETDTDPGCGSWVLDSDNDGVVELVSGSVQDECILAHRACPIDGGGCVETKIDACLVSNGALTCAQSTHFPTGAGGVEVTTAAYGATGEVLELGAVVYESGTFTGAGSVTGATGLQAVVLDVGHAIPRGEAAKKPVLALLSPASGELYVVQSGVPLATTAVGSIATTTILKGTSWAGLFTSTDLSGGESSGTAWVWVFDGSTADKGTSLGTVAGTVGLPDWDAGGILRVRDITLDSPFFGIERMAAAGEDLDGDGHPELFVEAWGEGRHHTWVVMAATDKASSLPVRTLAQPCGGTEDDDLGCNWAAVVHGDAALDVAVAPPSLVANETGIVVSGFLVDDNANPEADRIAGARVAVEWDIADVTAAEAAIVQPTGVSIIGKISARTNDGAASCRGHGWCSRGKCTCAAGWDGASMVVAGGGSGSAQATRDLTAGDFAFFGPSQGDDAVVGRRTFQNTDFPNTVVTYRGDYGDGELLGSFSLMAAGWSQLELGDWRHSVHANALLSVVGGNLAEGDHSTFGLVSEQDIVTGTVYASWIDGVRDPVRYPLPTDTSTAGSTRPVLLSERLSDANGALLAWRDGGGQAWIGLADVDMALAGRGGDALPFLEGPFPIGNPARDDHDLLGLSTDRPGAIGLLTRSSASAPFFGNEALETRIDGSSGTAGWACEDQCLEAVLITVGGDGSDECLFQTMYLPAAGTLSEMVDAATIRYRASDKSCSDLLVPLAAFSPVAEGPQFAVLGTPFGDVISALLANDTDVVSTKVKGPAAGNYDGGMYVSAGDVNGDSLSDLFIGGVADEGPVLLFSNGRGGFTESGVQSVTFTNFARLLSATGGKDRCDESGGMLPTYGRGTYLDLDDYP